MKTKKELMELRASKLTQMNTLVNERSDNMDEETLATVKTLKDEIGEVDRSLSAIETVRGIAVAGSKPVEAQIVDGKKEFRSMFTGYLRGTVTNKEVQERIMQAGTAGAGLETVPDEFYRTLTSKILEYGMLYADAKVMTTGNHGDFLIPMADDTANSGAWTAEGTAMTPADITTSQITMKAYKATTAIVVSTELLEDAFFDVESYVAGALGVRLARVFESAFINGDGTGKPTGIVADTGTVNVNSAVTLVVDETDMLNAIYAIDPSQRVGAVFYVSDAQRKAMDAWVDTTGRPLLQTNASATQAGAMETTLYGYPVRVNYELGSPLTVADVPVIFGNPQNYWIRNIRNITVKRSDELYALTDEVLFTATTRLDGKVVSENKVFSKITVIA